MFSLLHEIVQYFTINYTKTKIIKFFLLTLTFGASIYFILDLLSVIELQNKVLLSVMEHNEYLKSIQVVANDLPKLSDSVIQQTTENSWYYFFKSNWERIIFGTLFVGVVVGCLYFFSGANSQISTQLAGIDTKISNLDEKIGKVKIDSEQLVAGIDTKIAILGKNVPTINADSTPNSNMSTQFEGINTKIAALDKSVDNIHIDTSKISTQLTEIGTKINTLDQRVGSLHLDSAMVAKIPSRLQLMTKKVDSLHEGFMGSYQKVDEFKVTLDEVKGMVTQQYKSSASSSSSSAKCIYEYSWLDSIQTFLPVDFFFALDFTYFRYFYLIISLPCFWLAFNQIMITIQFS